jgi:cell division septum initiation protein DivIVA
LRRSPPGVRQAGYTDPARPIATMSAMDVTPQELRGSEIKEAWRGFNRDEVDDLLERAASTIENLTQQLQDIESRAPSGPDALPSSREDAEMLQRTLLLAQRAADEAVSEAQAHARQLTEESEARAQAVVSEAESTARRIAEGERRRLAEQIADLSARRDQLGADADALDEYVEGYRDRVRAALEADLALLGTASVVPPGPRPEVHEVELPPEALARPERAAEPERPPVPWEPAVEADPVPAWDPEPEPARPSYAESSYADSSYTDSARPSESEWPPPADPPSAGGEKASVGASAREGFAGSMEQGSSPSLSDASSSADASAVGLAPWEHPTAEHEPFAAETPIEAHSVDTGDALDDDAFFASLRDAVLDDEPLGPRENQYFDDEPVNERRGPFRRRR